MDLIIPNNIFSTLFTISIPEDSRPNLRVMESSLIVKELLNDENNIGLIPSFELIKNKELFVSSKIGLGFDGPLSNTYSYFANTDNKFKNINLRGDTSINEVILAKIVYKEIYNVEIDVILDNSPKVENDKSYLITGNENWEKNLFEKGISFSEHVSELINYPYINFVFASSNKDNIVELNSNYDNMNELILKNIDINLSKIDLDININSFIKNEIDSIYFELTDSEIEGLKELYKLAYYHQIMDDVFDIKFI